MQQWMKYLGLGAQFFVSIALMLALGWKLDEWLERQTPLLIWVLPLLIIIYTLVKLIIETNKKS
ncbi:MAG: AtpZ/AtpI family protein [Chitinophagia bacterium]|jgi:hypothetical protein